jgi:tetratricopeptide (TPR) repeat protein
MPVETQALKTKFVHPSKCRRASSMPLPLPLIFTLLWAALASASSHAAQTPLQLRHQSRAEADADVCAQRTGSSTLDIVTCTRAIKLGTHSPLTLATLHNTRGFAYRVTGRIDKALADHTAAIAANALSADAYLGRALTRIEATDLGGATSNLERASALFPKFSFAWKYRSYIALLQGKIAPAKLHLDHALELNAADGEAYEFRALAAFSDGRFDALSGISRQARRDWSATCTHQSGFTLPAFILVTVRPLHWRPDCNHSTTTMSGWGFCCKACAVRCKRKLLLSAFGKHRERSLINDWQKQRFTLGRSR